jgi:trans-aconitate methyltransferase
MAPSDQTKQVAFRLPEDLIARLDAQVERMKRRNPGITYTRADAARWLMTRMLDIVEAAERDQHQPKPKPVSLLDVAFGDLPGWRDRR